MQSEATAQASIDATAGGFWVWAGGIGLAVLGIAARVIPGTGGIVANLVHSVMDNKADRRVRSKAQAAERAGRLLAAHYDELPAEWRKRFPSGVYEAVHALRAQDDA